VLAVGNHLLGGFFVVNEGAFMRKKHILLKFLGLFSAVRGYNIAIVCLAQYLASIFVLSSQSWREVLLDERLFTLVWTGSLAIAGGYIINGFYDTEKDLINKPFKAMIDRLVSQNTRLTLYFLLNFLSVIVASYVSFRAVVFFSLYIFGMWLYSHRLKRLPLWGNLCSAALAIVPFFAVFVYYKNFDRAIFFHATLIYLLLLLKEFVKDLENIKGDLVHNYQTIPVRYGERFSKGMITLCVLLCFISMGVLTAHFSIGKLWYYFIFTGVCLLLLLVVLWSSDSRRGYAFLHQLIKVILVLGIFSVGLLGLKG
jgi:prenyltransferase family protein